MQFPRYIVPRLVIFPELLVSHPLLYLLLKTQHTCLRIVRKHDIILHLGLSCLLLPVLVYPAHDILS